MQYIQSQIEHNNIANKSREYNKLMSQINQYRLSPNIPYIMEYLYELYTIKNYKMIVKKKEEGMVLHTDRGDFDFEDYLA